ncbi:hypothetical protein ABBQ38_010524 [Trebouxia sp. C0009 RCD-2024]
MLQRRSRTLIQSARISGQVFCSAPSPHSPVHAASEQAKGLAAKALWHRRYQPLPGWLATLTVGAAAAGIVAANLEEVPLTGRKQLQIKWLQPGTKSMGWIPDVEEFALMHEPGRPNLSTAQNKQLRLDGGKLMANLFYKAVFSTHMLASEHPDLRARLFSLPETAMLAYYPDQLDSSVSYSEGPSCAWYDFWSIHKAKRQFKVMLSAGFLLEHRSINSLVWVMGHEFAHGIAKHPTESDSWALVATGVIFSRLALSTIPLLPAIALGCVLSTITRHVVIGRWLSQRHEHEADVIGTAIATAAGCSTKDILYALIVGCGGLAAEVDAERMLTEYGIPAHQQQVLARLRTLIPHGQLPGRIDDARDIRLISATIATELSAASAETFQLACKYLAELDVDLALCWLFLRDPLKPWVSTHPYWLDRIAHVKASKYFQEPHVARPVMTEAAAAHMLKYGYDGQALLTAYHASPEWPAFVAGLDRDLPHESAEEKYRTRVATRMRSPDSLLSWMDIRAARQYELFTSMC